jgi:hypothetical protein
MLELVTMNTRQDPNPMPDENEAQSTDLEEQPAEALELEIDSDVPVSPPIEPIPPASIDLALAIMATEAGPTLNTYANILLRPDKKRVKDSPILLLPVEIARIKELNDNDPAKWRWVAGQEHTRYIYMESSDVMITSISGYYSGEVKNKFRILDTFKKWVKVETLMAGSDWWKGPIPEYCLHNVYTFKGKLPPCGVVTLPVITRSGFGWIEGRQVGL